MTYRELFHELAKLTPEQFKQDVTIYDRSVDEWYPLYSQELENTSHPRGFLKSDVLDEGHVFLTIET